MAPTLVILESGTKIKKIQSFLGSQYKVKACFGHIRDLNPKELSIDISNNFEPKYEINKDKKKLVKELKDAYKECEGNILLATDLDREGEAIAFHLSHVLKVPKSKQKRLLFNEITKTALEKSLKNIENLNNNLVNAQQARRIVDRLVGYLISPILWKHLANKCEKGTSLSAGRVQSVVLKMIIDKEKQLKEFKPEPFYNIKGTFLVNNEDDTLEAKLMSTIESQDIAYEFLSDLKNATFKIQKIFNKKSTSSPPKPFITSTLQQEASNKFGWGPKKTMQVAQELYEKGLITYMRTDCYNLSDEFQKTLEEFIKKNHGVKYYKKNTFKTKNESAQEAHEAIRPCDVNVDASDLEGFQEKLYKCIRNTTIASQMAKEEYLTHYILIENDVYEDEIFESQLKETTFDGYIRLQDKPKADLSILDSLKVNSIIKYREILGNSDISKPKSLRYNEANLIKQLDKLEIGRPSTYSSMVSVVQDRQYVEKKDLPGITSLVKEFKLDPEKGVITHEKEKVFQSEKNKLVPTSLGYLVNGFMETHFPQIIETDFTRTLEKNLDKISQGTLLYTDLVKDVYDSFHNTLTELKGQIKNKHEKILGTHPETNEPITFYVGKYGPLISHNGNNVSVKDIPIEELTLTKALELLPQKLSNNITIKKGKFGAYFTYDGKNYSLKDCAEPYTPELCMELVSNKQKSTTKSFKNGMKLIEGKYGPYISYKGKNFKAPTINMSMDECIQLVNSKGTK